MPDITVADIPPINTYVINFPLPAGADPIIATTVFQFSFAVLNAAQVSVFLTPAGGAANDAEQILTFGIDYTVQINPAPAVGGTITLTVAAIGNSKITIVRNTSVARTSAYSDGTLLSASVLNADFNTTVMIEQETNRYNTMLCPHYNQTEITDNSDYVLPRLVRGQVWVKGLVPGTTTGQEAIIAESITNVLGGAPVSLINPPTIATTIPKFADTAGNIRGTTVKIDAGDNIIAPASINVTGTVNASAVTATNICRAATFVGTNLNITNANIQTNLTAANGSATILSNVVINGTLTANGVTNIPNLVLGDINLPLNNITGLTLSAPTITSTNMLKAVSANITGSLTVTAGGTTTISNQLIADNYTPANFRPININATGAINATGNIYTTSSFITEGGLTIRNPANLSTTINRLAGGATHTLTLPNALGNAGQVLALTAVANNVGTLSWANGGGGAGGITATLPTTPGNIPRFTDAAGNIGNSAATLDVGGNITAVSLNLTSPHPGRNDFHIGPYLGSAYTIYNLNLGDNINIALGGTGALRLQNFSNNRVAPLLFCDQNNTDGVSIQAPLTVPASYTMILPAAPPTAINQPLIVTNAPPAAPVLGWGTAPARAFGKITINDAGIIILTSQINIANATWTARVAGALVPGTVGDAIGIVLRFATPFPQNVYAVKVIFDSAGALGYTACVDYSSQTTSMCLITFRFIDAAATVVQTHLIWWTSMKSFVVECT